MNSNEKKFFDTKTQKKIEYYESLGLTPGQVILLSLYTYDDYAYKLNELLFAYKNSKFLHDGVSFSQVVEQAYNDINKNKSRNIKDALDAKLRKMLNVDETKIDIGDTPLTKGKSSLFGSFMNKFSTKQKSAPSPSYAGGMGMSGMACSFGSSSASQSFVNNVNAVTVDSLSSECEADFSCCESSSDIDCDECEADFDCYECEADIECYECDEDEGIYECEAASNSVTDMNMIDLDAEDEDILDECKVLVNTLESAPNAHKKVINSPTSTFKASCSKVALDLARANTFSSSTPRLEEIVNYLDYDLGTPENKFKVVTELMNHPDDSNKQLLFIGVQGNKLIPKRQNVVVLLDVSGSMSGNQEETQMAIVTLVSKLNIGDKFSLITYSSNDNVVIDDIIIKENSIDFIIERLLGIKICGCTYGSKGLYSAYQLIHKNKIEDGVNRIVLFTDGDFNFSLRDVFNISGEVEDIVLAERDKEAYISVVGCGKYLDDKIMSTVARNGNGNYCIIYDTDSVDRNINKAYNELMHAIAKDVKIQVEFNPAVVDEYKLFGYETRALNHEDFKNDKIVAEPFGSGAHAVALYELIPVKNTESVKSDLKYQKVELTDTSELCTVSLRYKDVESEDIKQIDTVVENKISESTANCSKAYKAVKAKDDLQMLMKLLD